MAKRDFFDVMKETLNNMGTEVGAELSRLGRQGSLEMAQALFNGAAFTPYGPGQYSPAIGVSQEQEAQKAEPDQGQERDRGGRE